MDSSAPQAAHARYAWAGSCGVERAGTYHLPLFLRPICPAAAFRCTNPMALVHQRHGAGGIWKAGDQGSPTASTGGDARGDPGGPVPGSARAGKGRHVHVNPQCNAKHHPRALRSLPQLRRGAEMHGLIAEAGGGARAERRGASIASGGAQMPLPAPSSLCPVSRTSISYHKRPCFCQGAARAQGAGLAAVPRLNTLKRAQSA